MRGVVLCGKGIFGARMAGGAGVARLSGLCAGGGNRDLRLAKVMELGGGFGFRRIASLALAGVKKQPRLIAIWRDGESATVPIMPKSTPCSIFGCGADGTGIKVHARFGTGRRGCGLGIFKAVTNRNGRFDVMTAYGTDTHLAPGLIAIRLLHRCPIVTGVCLVYVFIAALTNAVVRAARVNIVGFRQKVTKRRD